MGRRRKWGFSWSWRRASGYSAAKGRLSRRLGVPLTRAGRQRKVGASLGCSVLILAVSLFAAATGACRPDGGPKVWDWPKEKAATDGPICLEVGHLTGEADAPAWELGLVVTNTKTGESEPTRGARFVGVTVADDRGGNIPFKQLPQTPHNLSFDRRPDAKAKFVVIQFGRHPDRSGLSMTIPAATVRGLTARTSHYRKTVP